MILVVADTTVTEGMLLLRVLTLGLPITSLVMVYRYKIRHKDFPLQLLSAVEIQLTTM